MTQHATASAELGRVEGLEELIAEARAQAVSERHLFALMVLDGLEIPWHAMRAEFDQVEALIADMTALHERMAVEQSGDALMGAVLMRMVWGGQVQVLLDLLSDLEGVTVMPADSSLAAMLCRIDRVDEARLFLRDREIDLSPDWWFSSMVAAMAAEAALYTEDPDLAAAAYASMSGFSGQLASAGSGTALGPVDAFLAMAAAATGERELAAKHADNAARLCVEWRPAGWPVAFRGPREVRFLRRPSRVSPRQVSCPRGRRWPARGPATCHPAPRRPRTP